MCPDAPVHEPAFIAPNALHGIRRLLGAQLRRGAPGQRRVEQLQQRVARVKAVMTTSAERRSPSSGSTARAVPSVASMRATDASRRTDHLLASSGSPARTSALARPEGMPLTEAVIGRLPEAERRPAGTSGPAPACAAKALAGPRSSPTATAPPAADRTSEQVGGQRTAARSRRRACGNRRVSRPANSSGRPAACSPAVPTTMGRSTTAPSRSTQWRASFSASPFSPARSAWA